MDKRDKKCYNIQSLISFIHVSYVKTQIEQLASENRKNYLGVVYNKNNSKFYFPKL